MNKTRPYTSPLRQRQAADTRRRIVEAALQLLEQQPEEPFSHEQISQRAEIALRTIYRYFPSRTELLDAVWQESNKRMALKEYPATEDGLLSSIEPVFRKADENAVLFRALLRSNAGREMRSRDAQRRRANMMKALSPATAHLSNDQRRLVIAVFQSLFSGSTWDLMRDRGRLKDGEVSKAIHWAMETLLKQLHHESAAWVKGPPVTGRSVKKPPSVNKASKQREK